MDDTLKKTPLEWAKAKQLTRDPIFAAADVYYQWSEYAYHYQADPQLLSEKAFDSAMTAASYFPAKPLAKAGLNKLSAKRAGTKKDS